MKTLVQLIKSIKLTQVLTVFLAGVLMIVSTACSQGNIAQTNSEPEIDANQVALSKTDDYTDTVRDTKDTQAKVKALVDTAKSRQAGDFGDYVDNLGDRIQDQAEDAKNIPDYLEDRKDAAVKDIKKRTNTLKENLSNAPDEAKRVIEGAADTAQDAAEDATEAAKNTGKELKGNVKDLT